jgi:hypothetical protein
MRLTSAICAFALSLLTGCSCGVSRGHEPATGVRMATADDCHACYYLGEGAFECRADPDGDPTCSE